PEGRSKASSAGEDGGPGGDGRERYCGPRRRLPLGGKVKDDAEAKSDCKPRHQPAGPHIRQGPRSDALGGAPSDGDKTIGPHQSGPHGAGPRLPRFRSPPRFACSAIREVAPQLDPATASVADLTFLSVLRRVLHRNDVKSKATLES